MMVPRLMIASAFSVAALLAGAPPSQAGRSCALVGDSIAVEAGEHLRSCRLNAKGGIPSEAVIARVDPAAEINVISAGSNDPDNPALRANLERIRERTKRTIWILPTVPRAREAVQAVAARHGDAVVSFAPRDGVHPVSAATLAQAIDAVIAQGG